MKPNASDPGMGRGRFRRLGLLIMGCGFCAGVPTAAAEIATAEETGAGDVPVCADVVNVS